MPKLFVWRQEQYGELWPSAVGVLACDIDEARKLAKEKNVEYPQCSKGKGLDREPQVFDYPSVLQIWGEN